MGSTFGDDLPPRKPKRRPRPPGEITEGAETFQPSPVPPARPKAPKKPKSSPKEIDDARPEAGGPGFVERVVFGSVSTKHLAKFCRQFAAYQSAGVDLLRSLSSLQKQFAATALGPVLERLILAVRRGNELSDAMAREPQAFDPLFLSMIRVAEARGGIPETLRTMADHYEARLRLIRQARSGLIYPAAVVVIATVVILLLTIFVLPKLTGILAEMAGGRSMPLPTRLLIGFGEFITRMGWWALPAALVGAVFGLLWLYRRPAGKAMLDEVGLMIPVIGGLLRKIDTARMARTLSSLLEAGVDLNASLGLAADVVALTPFKRVMRGARVTVAEGEELSQALERSRRFDPEVVYYVESGEETGRLPESLAKLADDYEEQVSHMVRNLGSLLQPLIIIVLGGIVLFIALAFVMAYITLISGLSAGL